MFGYIVRKTKVGNLEVSTCALPFGAGVETMVFDDHSGESDVRGREFTRRHRTEDDAILWHEVVVATLTREAEQRASDLPRVGSIPSPAARGVPPDRKD